MNEAQRNEIAKFVSGNNQPTTDHRITCKYLSNLIRNQVKDYSDRELIYTSLIKDKFLEVLDTPEITAEERAELMSWVSYIFAGEKEASLSLVLLRCNSMIHQNIN